MATMVQGPPQKHVGSTPTPPQTGADRVILHGVSWQTYDSLLADYVDVHAPRFAYDRGTLEILVTLSTEHERVNQALISLVNVLAEEWGIDILGVGSMTYRREDLERGCEPDSSFYIRHVARVRGRRQIDPAVDPPPDLVIEVDVTHSSLDKLPLYAGLGVPELWRYEGERVSIHLLRAGAYEEVLSSAALPNLASDVLTLFVEQGRTLTGLDWLRIVREWAKQQVTAERGQS